MVSAHYLCRRVESWSSRCRNILRSVVATDHPPAARMERQTPATDVGGQRICAICIEQRRRIFDEFGKSVGKWSTTDPDIIEVTLIINRHKAAFYEIT